MSKYKITYSLLLAVGLLTVVILNACSPTQKAVGAPLPPEKPAGDAKSESVYVDSVDVMILESFPVQVRARITGHLPDGCTEITSTDVTYEEASKTFFVEFETYRDPELMCTQALVPFEKTVDLEVRGLSAGHYTVDVPGAVASFELATDNVLPED
ncbi:MAG: hypothetical protein ACP5HS_05155 [Anaerolineae bacterium]